MNEHEDPQMIAELKNLPREMQPPAGLEDRVVDGLRSEHLVAPSASSGISVCTWQQLACSLRCSVGFGRDLVPQKETSQVAMGRYLILLAEPRTLEYDKVDRRARQRILHLGHRTGTTGPSGCGRSSPARESTPTCRRR